MKSHGMRVGAEATELAADLERRGPEVGAVAGGGDAGAVGADERADGVAGAEDERGGAEAALEAGGQRAGAAAGGAEGEVCRGVVEGRAPKRAVGVVGPALVAAVEEIEEDGAGDDRDGDIGDREPPALRAEAVADAGAGIEAEGGAAAQDDRIDGLDELVGREQLGLARAGRAAHDVDRGEERPVGGQHGRPGLDPVVLGVADEETGDIGDEIARTGFHALSRIPVSRASSGRPSLQ